MFAPDLSTARWRKSSRSSDKANCVEVAVTGPAVAVRDSKHPTGGALIVPPRAWTAFTTALRDGELGRACVQVRVRADGHANRPCDRELSNPR